MPWCLPLPRLPRLTGARLWQPRLRWPRVRRGAPCRRVCTRVAAGRCARCARARCMRRWGMHTVRSVFRPGGRGPPGLCRMRPRVLHGVLHGVPKAWGRPARQAPGGWGRHAKRLRVRCQKCPGRLRQAGRLRRLAIAMHRCCSGAPARLVRWRARLHRPPDARPALVRRRSRRGPRALGLAAPARALQQRSVGPQRGAGARRRGRVQAREAYQLVPVLPGAPGARARQLGAVGCEARHGEHGAVLTAG